MEGVFAEGTILWYWYDGWVATPVLALAVILSLRLIVGTSWRRPVPLLAKIITLVGIVLVGMTVLDRLGVYVGIQEPTTFGSASIAGGVVAIVLGLLSLFFRGARPELAPAAAAPGGAEATVTPEEGTDVTLLAEEGEEEAAEELEEETRVAQQEEAPTMMAGGAGATQIGGAQATQMSAPASPPARLEVRVGSDSGRSFSIAKETTTIGRSSDNDIVLQDATVSRHHARLTREGQSYTVEDAGSSAGIFVDGAKVDRRQLRSGSILRLGETELTLVVETPQQEAATMMAGPAPTAVVQQQQPPDSGATMVMGQQTQAHGWLLARKGAQAGQSFSLQGETVTIGRDPDNVIRLEDATVSRHHALARVQADKVLLYDVGSSSGTRVNGEPLQGAPLREGSRLQVGGSEILFIEISGGQAPPAGQGGQTMVLRQESHGTLMVRSGPAAGQSFNLGDGDLVLGREPGAGGAQIDDSSISRRHALVRKTPEGYAVYDLGSANGTVVDGVTLSGREIHNGDIVQVGEAELQFVSGDAA